MEVSKMPWDTSRYTTIVVDKKTHEKLVYLKMALRAHDIPVRSLNDVVNYLIDKYFEYLRLLEEKGE